MNALVAAARALPLAWLALPGVAGLGRFALGLALALAVLPAAAPPPESPLLALLLARELLIGLALGFAASVPLRAAQTAGRIVDAARRPEGDGDLLGRAYALLALVIFVAAGGPALWLDGLAESYRALPVGHAPSAGSSLAIDAAARLFGAAVELAAPALTALLIADLVLGLTARAARSLAPVGGAAAREWVGLLAVAATATALAASLAGGFVSLGRELAAAVRGLAG